MSTLRCVNCSFLNFATASACKRCGLSFESSAETDAVTQWNEQPYASPETYPQPNEGGSYFWDQPSYQPTYAPPPMVKSSGVSTLVKVFVAVALVALVAFVAIPVLLKSTKTDFTKLSWSEVRSPDGKFSVSLPSTAKISERVIPTPFGNAQARKFEAEISKEAGCMLLYADYPDEFRRVPEDNIYQAALQGASGRKEMAVVGAQKYITVDGYRGMEAELKPSDPSLKITGGARLFWVAPRLYVIGAGGPDTAEFKAVQTRCLESFRLHRSS